jgi:hypothetical protein
MGATLRRSGGERRRAGILTVALLAVGVLAACGASEAKLREMRQISKSYLYTITPDQAPPHAREPILYKILIRDRDTREPIENGEGQIYSNNREGARTWDGLTYGPQIGTYYGKLSYVVAGQWAVGIRFRRDSLHPLETIDWMQDVFDERKATTK